MPKLNASETSVTEKSEGLMKVMMGGMDSKEMDKELTMEEKAGMSDILLLLGKSPSDRLTKRDVFSFLIAKATSS